MRETTMQGLEDPRNGICYRSTFLKQAIIRLDFTQFLESINTRLPSDVRTTAEALFPIAEPRKTIGQLLFSVGVVDPSKPPAKNTQTISWIFYDERKEKTLEIAHNALILT